MIESKKERWKEKEIEWDLMWKDAKTDGMGERVRYIILSVRESKLIERKQRQKDR